MASKPTPQNIETVLSLIPEDGSLISRQELQARTHWSETRLGNVIRSLFETNQVRKVKAGRVVYYARTVPQEAAQEESVNAEPKMDSPEDWPTSSCAHLCDQLSNTYEQMAHLFRMEGMLRAGIAENMMQMGARVRQ